MEQELLKPLELSLFFCDHHFGRKKLVSRDLAPLPLEPELLDYDKRLIEFSVFTEREVLSEYDVTLLGRLCLDSSVTLRARRWNELGAFVLTLGELISSINSGPLESLDLMVTRHA